MVKIKSGDDTYQISNYQWTGTNDVMVAFLNSRLSIWGPSGADPSPDYTAAQDALQFIGGEIVEYDEPPFDDEAIY